MSTFSAWEAVAAAAALGIQLRVNGNRIQARIPDGDREQFSEALDCLRAHGTEVAEWLRTRARTAPTPPGVHLLKWELKKPPVAIETYAVVTEPAGFAQATLQQLGIALNKPDSWIGWTVPQLMDRLRQVGVDVILDPHSKGNSG